MPRDTRGTADVANKPGLSAGREYTPPLQCAEIVANIGHADVFRAPSTKIPD
jgi:hypothetical protein